ncbi:MAG TPA: quinoprotein dehydrogenase-associated putative ABC transporter substrate-binding protein [Usitatibacter sp.]|nr:quinoprotein dehydrogenase-associated putative ABC transporter substrate-binding protein [Usitatibacter sp.]
MIARPRRRPRIGHILLAFAGLALLLFAFAAVAQQAHAAAFRPCVDPNNLPFSDAKGEGYENRIAELFGRSLGIPVKSYQHPMRMNFVRNTLRYKLPDQDYPCDVLMNVPAEFDQAWVTAPYYRSTYVLVYRKGGKLEGVTSGDALFDTFRDAKARPVVGIFDRSPASAWLARHGWEEQARVYHMLSADPEDYPGEIIARDLVHGTIDAAVVWGPIGGYFAKRSAQPLVVVPLRSEPGVRFDYDMAMGVRYGDREWKGVVERLIVENKAAITAILREYNVPLLDARGELLE